MSSSSTSPYKGFYLFFCGLCMGTADLVPGISGGTIAFIMGFYQPLLESLKTINLTTLKLLVTFQWRRFFQQVAWKFLLTLVGGIACAILGFSSFLHMILSNEVYRVYLYAGFLGLILASFTFCLRQISQWSWKVGAGLLIGILSAYFLTDATLAPQTEGGYAVRINSSYSGSDLSNYSVKEKLLKEVSESTLGVLLAKKVIQPNTPVYNEKGEVVGIASHFATLHRMSFFDVWLVACGAIAVCALLLPGVSGSYLLTLLGVYPIVIAALADFVAGLGQFAIDLEALSVLFSLLVGIVLGAIGFARFVSALLRHYPDLSLAVLSGFMIGALRSVWPFWSYTHALVPLKLDKGPQLILLHPIWPSLDSSLFWLACLCCAIGYGIVFFVEYMAKCRVNEVADPV